MKVYDAHRDHGCEEFTDVCGTVLQQYGTGGGNVPMVVEEPVCFPGVGITSPQNGNNPNPGDPCHSLTSDSRNYLVEPDQQWIVRRLTPTEVERLQGFPDGWTDIGEWVDSKGKRHKAADGPRYKALGNSIAVGYANGRSGFWCWLLKRISATYERSATLGSLFDGIGGFPLAWEAVNGKGSARWASEIEEFPIAVTKKHFKEEN